jgi:hypothetical protein
MFVHHYVAQSIRGGQFAKLFRNLGAALPGPSR